MSGVRHVMPGYPCTGGEGGLDRPLIPVIEPRGQLTVVAELPKKFFFLFSQVISWEGTQPLSNGEIVCWWPFATHNFAFVGWQRAKMVGSWAFRPTVPAGVR